MTTIMIGHRAFLRGVAPLELVMLVVMGGHLLLPAVNDPSVLRGYE